MAIFRLPVLLSNSILGPGGAVNVWHFRTSASGALGGEEINSAVDSIRKFYESLCGLGTAPGQVLLNGTTVKAEAATEVGADTLAAVTWSTLTVPDSAAAAPPMACITVNWLTQTAARRGRGRTMLGPLPSSSIESNGTIAAGTLTNARNAAAALATRNLADNGWAVGVYGLQERGGLSTAPHVLRDITSSKVNDHFTWLRSRGN